MTQRNPQLASFSTDDLIAELVARQADMMSRMNAAIGLFNGAAATTAPSLPSLPTKRTHTKAQASKGASAPRALKEDGIQFHVLRALKELGEPSSPADIWKKMVELGWTTTSAKPYATVYSTMQFLSKSKTLVKGKNKLWSIGPGADKPKTRKPRTVRNGASPEAAINAAGNASLS